jgi:glycosyltransferase involved in cell wall biosynthesis
VFPTLQDLVGRVVVEALTLGVPVVLSPMTGAAGTVVHDGVNGLILRAVALVRERRGTPAGSAA